MKPSRRNIPAALVAFAIALWVSVEPALHAARLEGRELSFSERIFEAATEGERLLKAHTFEERDPNEYPRIIDLFRQVTETASDPALADRSLIRMADLTRELALRTGDATQFTEAIDVYRRLVTTRPKSPYVGDALVAIAQIYEYDLQDVDGATAAYRELQRRFSDSVAGREANANLARLDTTSGGSSGTSVIGSIVAPGAELPYATGPVRVRVLNIRSFAGPNYARVIVDLDGVPEYAERRSGTRMTVTIPGAELTSSLLGRRLSSPQGSLLKGMRVEQMGDGVTVTLDATTLGSSSAFLTEEPKRLVIDLRGASGRRPLVDTSGLPTRAAVEDAIGLAVPAPTVPEALPPLPPVPGAPEIKLPPPSTGAAAAVVRCIVIDPGHGGQDTGTIGPGGLYEKSVTLDIARRLRASLRAELPGVEIVLTRDTDRYVSLEERTAIANAREADLFVSIHANASESSRARGIETYIADPEALKTERHEHAEGEKDHSKDLAYASVSFASQITESRSLARYVQGSLVSGLSAKHPNAARDRGIKHASFAVLRGAHMPSVLAEVSFVSNPEDENKLRTSGFRQKIANSLTAGIRRYVKSAGRG